MERVIVSGQSDSKFKGIDNNFLDLIYFSSNEEKVLFLKSIHDYLNKLKIYPGESQTSVQDKILDTLDDLEQPIDFLFDCLQFDEIHLEKTIEGETVQVMEEIKEEHGGLFKIQGFYAGIKFGITNIKRKIIRNFYNVRFEESIILKEIELNRRMHTLYNTPLLLNFVLLEAYFTLGMAYFHSNDYLKADEYFCTIKKTEFYISDSNIAVFYRKIGELYLSKKQNDKALDWLEAGLKLDQKLGVKKLISKIKNV